MRRTVDEHRAAVAGLLRWSSGYDGAGAEVLPLAAALGRALAGDVAAPVSLPPFANSQMDGYAVHADDLAGRDAFEVADAIPAGSVPPALAPGTAAPIMTGAMLPEGAAAVVPIERADPAQFHSATDRARGPVTVRLPAGIDAGLFVRNAGSDIAEGEAALRAGTLLGPAQLGLLAACGVGEVPVRPRFRVLLLSTGDEVAEPGAPLAPGSIYDANTTLLEAALREAGAEVSRHRLLGDDPAVLRDAFGAIPAGSTHLVLSTGGISQGAYEVVKQALADSSVEFSSVAMQPGGPQAHGTISGIPFLGFPGNPVSAIVSFEMFLRPALHQLTGVPAPRPVLEAVLVDALDSPRAKHQLRRGLYRDGKVALVGGPDSHLLHALAASNCLVHVPEGVAALAPGDRVEVTLMGPVPTDPFAVEDVLVLDEAGTDAAGTG
ncbi:gephyrin-like molybdotransferase Glp [Arthrobacter ruber]|uniref:molybdopterin molybdotransferase MoeA n=1 Tax=Arthrobacter ruber TaxID=1258893 RepID=UPI000CF4A609|nr:gephyrin-like molybdotransferase Glp [Arthrobacter ruber]